MNFSGFFCTKNALIALNAVYIIVAFILISVGGYAKGASIVTSLTIVGGIIAVGVFLLLVAILGLCSISKHHQVLLFFYMIILFCVFLIQFFVAVACLGMVSPDQVSALITKGWRRSDNDTIWDAEKNFNCCGLFNNDDQSFHCEQLPCWPKCDPCLDKITQLSDANLQLSGEVGLFFSFTEFFGVWLTICYRNQHDPHYHWGRSFM